MHSMHDYYEIVWTFVSMRHALCLSFKLYGSQNSSKLKGTEKFHCVDEEIKNFPYNWR